MTTLYGYISNAPDPQIPASAATDIDNHFSDDPPGSNVCIPCMIQAAEKLLSQAGKLAAIAGQAFAKNIVPALIKGAIFGFAAEVGLAAIAGVGGAPLIPFILVGGAVYLTYTAIKGGVDLYNKAKIQTPEQNAKLFGETAADVGGGFAGGIGGAFAGKAAIKAAEEQALKAAEEQALKEAEERAIKETAPKTPTRVDQPGNRPDKYNTFKTNEDVPDRYRGDSRFDSLSSDPDQGGKISSKTRQEAMAGLEAENQGITDGAINRGPKGIEFYDKAGTPYDVKAPRSPNPGDRFAFNADEAAASIKSELATKGNPPGTFPNGNTGDPAPRQVILDSTYMNEADHALLWERLNNNLTPEELGRIHEINTQL